MYSVGFLIVHCYVLSCVSISMVAPYSLTIIMYKPLFCICHLTRLFLNIYNNVATRYMQQIDHSRILLIIVLWLLVRFKK